MSEESSEEMRAHAPETVGGWHGHIFRRTTHLLMVLIPVIYYWWGESIADILSGYIGQDLSRERFVSIIMLLAILGESWRIRSGYTIFGQREYEARQISALAWGGVSIALCLLAAPRGGLEGAYIGLPIIVTLSLVDPVLGEGRRYIESTEVVTVLGVLVAALIWGLSAFYLGTPAWLAVLMPPLAVAAEWPRLKLVDDNAMMVLVPLAAALMVQPWF